MAVEIMTMRAFLEGIEGKVEGDYEDKRVALLRGLDEKNEKRANTPTKKQKDNEPVKAQIVEYLKNEGKAILGTEIAKALGLTTQKVTGLARLLVADGVINAVEVAVKGKGKQKAYEYVAEGEDA